MKEDEKQNLLVLATAYKEHVYEKLLDLLPEHLARIEATLLQGLPLNDGLGPMCLQGVGEALDGFDVEKLWVLAEEEATPAVEA